MLNYYESAIMLDISLAEKQEIEQKMWKKLFYNFIEEYRRKVKEEEESPKRDNEFVDTDEVKISPLQNEFISFLESSCIFYLNFINKLRETYQISDDIILKMKLAGFFSYFFFLV